MLFNSLAFLAFLFILVLLYYTVGSRFKKYVLLVGNLVFFYYVDPCLAIVPIFITILTFGLGIIIERSKYKAIAFLFGTVVILGILIFYKYSIFFMPLTKFLIDLFGIKGNSFPSFLTPLGISYISFQAIGYLIELKRASYSSERNIVQFSNFLLFFSKAQAGPVEQASNMLPQLSIENKFQYNNIVEGVRLIAWGFFKKIVIASSLVKPSSVVFQDLNDYNGKSLLIGMFYNTIQLYVDFSSYTDIARGSAKLFGIDLMKNFTRPFLSKNVTEFWRNWHISLSTWFNVYVFGPLSVSTRNWGKFGIMFSLIITFVLIGIWHGATVNFVFFGLLHGLILCIELALQK
ncbi:MAG TPA: MBOAT family O-acyltransferase, partial [Bacteroidia bacterium]|nr:MBOAT family O-acyltransferase [Bacteroidia bacterium]